jgi:hypothetical protein
VYNFLTLLTLYRQYIAAWRENETLKGTVETYNHLGLSTEFSVTRNIVNFNMNTSNESLAMKPAATPL